MRVMVIGWYLNNLLNVLCCCVVCVMLCWLNRYSVLCVGWNFRLFSFCWIGLIFFFFGIRFCMMIDVVFLCCFGDVLLIIEDVVVLV